MFQVRYELNKRGISFHSKHHVNLDYYLQKAFAPLIERGIAIDVHFSPITPKIPSVIIFSGVDTEEQIKIIKELMGKYSPISHYNMSIEN